MRRAREVTFGALPDRYIAEEMLTRHSTRSGYSPILKNYLRPQWGSRVISEIRPAELHSWLPELALGLITQGHLRSLTHKLFDPATLWEYLPSKAGIPLRSSASAM